MHLLTALVTPTFSSIHSASQWERKTSAMHQLFGLQGRVHRRRRALQRLGNPGRVLQEPRLHAHHLPQVVQDLQGGQGQGQQDGSRLVR